MTSPRRPIGTRDFGPDEMARRRAAEAVFRATFESFGYREVATPTFEDLALFTLKSGPGVVEELYAFEDKGGRAITLRPELTAPVLRFYVNELSREPKPLKLYYFGNCFRYEQPQSGRYREFWQFGTEVIGAATPEADAEVVALAATTLARLGLDEIELRVGHIGVLKGLAAAIGLGDEDRLALFRIVDKDKVVEQAADVERILGTCLPEDSVHAVRDFLADLAEPVRPEDLEGVERSLARLGPLATKLEPTVAPALKHLAEIGTFLRAAGHERFLFDLGVVRGLDYYTGMVFEIEAASLGAEKQVVGGGAYALAELFGGEPVASVGFGMGFDRILLALEREGKAPAKARLLDAFLVPIGEKARGEAVALARELREAGLAVATDLMRRNPTKNMDYANAVEARAVVVLGPKEIEAGTASVKDMASGTQETIPRAELSAHLKARRTGSA
ncbi:MAG TPA: histidine--tRNA ligase [Candidatus Thermoplasmatota archaeon]|nr:histidine--tRNA ligase [Candidatus Thermoplasmatota archaeon]